MKKVTKKQISEETITVNYHELKNVFLHMFEYDGNMYECRTFRIASHLPIPDNKVYFNEYQVISSANNKKEFINAVYLHVNK